MLWILHVFKFITLLRFPSGTPVTAVIERRYGHPTLVTFRQWERNWRKLEKLQQDLFFLKRRDLYDVIPKFLNFKLYNRHLEHHTFYGEWQRELLQKEIRTKEKQLEQLEELRLPVMD